MKIYEYTKPNNSRFLWKELQQNSSIKTSLKNINQKGDKIYIVMEDEFNDADKPLIDAVITNHNKSSYDERVQIDKIIEDGLKFGEGLLTDFAAENVSLGITQLGLTNHIRKTLSEVVNALATSALNDTIYEISQVPAESLDSQVLTEARLLRFRNNIEEYLNLPISSSYNQ